MCLGEMQGKEISEDQVAVFQVQACLSKYSLNCFFLSSNVGYLTHKFYIFHLIGCILRLHIRPVGDDIHTLLVFYHKSTKEEEGFRQNGERSVILVLSSSKCQILFISHCYFLTYGKFKHLNSIFVSVRRLDVFFPDRNSLKYRGLFGHHICRVRV